MFVCVKGGKLTTIFGEFSHQFPIIGKNVPVRVKKFSRLFRMTSIRYVTILMMYKYLDLVL